MAYCLGITKVDPIEHKLLFERFINEARTLPDIDIDFDVNRREEVIQYLYDRYGEDHSAMVCTVITYRARSAVREVAKALGFPPEAVDRVAKALDTRDASDVARDLALDGSFGWLFDELGVDMEAEAVPSNRDGRRTDGGALVARQSDSSWNHRPRPVLARLRCRSAPTWPMPRRAPGTQRATTTGGRTASPAGCRRAGRGCSTSRSSRSSTRAGSRSATVPAACASTRRPRSCPCRGRATTARPAPPAIVQAWCGWTRSRACRSRSAAARASCRRVRRPILLTAVNQRLRAVSRVG